MTTKSCTVMARVEPEIKEKAESILSALGVSSSGIINMLYRQIILTHGIPFPITMPHPLPVLEEMPQGELDSMLEKGLAQAKAKQGYTLDEVFDALEKDI